MTVVITLFAGQIQQLVTRPQVSTHPQRLRGVVAGTQGCRQQQGDHQGGKAQHRQLRKKYVSGNKPQRVAVGAGCALDHYQLCPLLTDEFVNREAEGSGNPASGADAGVRQRLSVLTLRQGGTGAGSRGAYLFRGGATDVVTGGYRAFQRQYIKDLSRDFARELLQFCQ